MDLRLEGKVFLITGGSSGLGLALARRLLEEGARGVGLMARDAERLGNAATALRETGGDVLELAGDVRRVEDLERFVEDSVAQWGRIDGLANNAGELAAAPSPSTRTQRGRRIWP